MEYPPEELNAVLDLIADRFEDMEPESYYTSSQNEARKLYSEKYYRLFAAAPELLVALLNIENDGGSIPAPIWEMRNKAIAKAIGENQ